jgi:hypothetical protein
MGVTWHLTRRGTDIVGIWIGWNKIVLRRRTFVRINVIQCYEHQSRGLNCGGGGCSIPHAPSVVISSHQGRSAMRIIGVRGFPHVGREVGLLTNHHFALC